ncbi:hypothetical protein EUGRSUZ_L00837 [Eucalyptus grandis]|uniref:Uncharacterized protein n=1 Tax=Eucalyptus grandis TaxID=71139 RepID=A0A058ZUL8_EUCGR|nr:hypothetical protein EUGRSUZ_L00837 [Eucalyptus grandis]
MANIEKPKFHILEQTNELLLKNHDLRLAGSKALPEAHANFEKNTGHFKGYKRKQEHNPRRDGKKFNRPRKSNFGLNHGKEKKPKKVINESICHRRGMIGHWSRICRTPKHFVDLYQTSLKKTGKRCESHKKEDACLLDSATTHTIFCSRHFFSSMTLRKAQIHTISGPVPIIDGFGNATIILPNGTILHIENAFLSI